MKLSSISPLLFAGSLLFSTAANAIEPISDGNLTVVFYQLDPLNVVGPEYFVMNLGPASLYRENSTNGLLVSAINPGLVSSSIGSDLTERFGPTWYDDGTVRWMVLGTVPAGAATVAGDPGRTNYYSAARGALGSGPASSIQTFTATNRGNLNTELFNFLLQGSVNDAILGLNGNTHTPGNNPASAVIPTSNPKPSVDQYLPPSTLTYFKIASDPRQTLNAGPIGSVEGALDIYRILQSATGADLTAGASAGNAVVGQPQYIGALTIDSAGTLKIQGIGAASGNFASWAATNGVTGGPSGDSDFDGLSNLTEYALATNPAGSDGAAGNFSGGTITFAKRDTAVTNGDVSYAIQVSNDLGLSDPWQSVSATSDTAALISYNLTNVAPRKFARLVVKQVP